MKYLLIPLCSAVFLSACGADSNATKDLNTDAKLLVGPAPTITHTPSANLLSCVSFYRNRNKDVRIAVGDIVDGTGAKTFSDGTSPLFSQRPDLMVTVALAKTGITTLNRTSSRVSEWEISQAMDKRLGDGHDIKVGEDVVPFRPIAAGEILGSTHYLTGAITEVNWNVDSSGKHYNIAGIHNAKNVYRISIAVDLLLTETTTTKVVKAQSFTKQLVGVEVEKGVFRFFSADNGVLDSVELFDASVGEQKNEPVQRALRWVIEFGTYDMVADLVGARKSCDTLLTSDVLPEKMKAAEAVPAAKKP